MLTDQELGAIRGRLYSIYPGLEESVAEGRGFTGTGWDAPDMLALLAEIDRLRKEACPVSQQHDLGPIDEVALNALDWKAGEIAMLEGRLLFRPSGGEAIHCIGVGLTITASPLETD